jgi:hypothetical protein
MDVWMDVGIYINKARSPRLGLVGEVAKVGRVVAGEGSVKVAKIGN